MRVYRSGGYPCGIGDCKTVCPTPGALGGHRVQYHPSPDRPPSPVGQPKAER